MASSPAGMGGNCAPPEVPSHNQEAHRALEQRAVRYGDLCCSWLQSVGEEPGWEGTPPHIPPCSCAQRKGREGLLGAEISFPAPVAPPGTVSTVWRADVLGSQHPRLCSTPLQCQHCSVGHGRPLPSCPPRCGAEPGPAGDRSSVGELLPLISIPSHKQMCFSGSNRQLSCWDWKSGDNSWRFFVLFPLWG